MAIYTERATADVCSSIALRHCSILCNIPQVNTYKHNADVVTMLYFVDGDVPGAVTPTHW